MSNIFWPDVLRYLFIGQVLLSLIFAIVVITRYSFKLSISHLRDRPLPWHLVCIGTSYLIFASGWMFVVRDRLGDPLTWRTPLGLVAAALGNVGMIFMTFYLSVQRLIVDAVIEKVAEQAAREITKGAVTDVIAPMVSDLRQRVQKGVELAESTHEKVTALANGEEKSSDG